MANRNISVRLQVDGGRFKAELVEAGRTGQQAQRGYAQRQAEHQQYLDRQAAKERDRSRPLTPAEEYARWSNAVQAAGTGGRAGAAAYYGNTKPPR